MPSPGSGTVVVVPLAKLAVSVLLGPKPWPTPSIARTAMPRDASTPETANAWLLARPEPWAKSATGQPPAPDGISGMYSAGWTIALVHEAYLRLIDQRFVTWQNRAHFFAIAARMMRRLIIEHARRRVAERRGGGAPHVALDEAGQVSLERAGELLALDEALDELATVDPRKSQVVELRFFGGLNVQETAATLGVSEITVMRDWSTARAWLHRSIAGSAGSNDA